ncbi:MAG: efflux RND transporter permease subunit [Alphaproteobacteria bacterium]|nr:efflux RND transporter permease subunit [Alphaproteobacteria bacterium]
MNFIEFLIRRPVLATVMSIILVMIGGVSYTRLSLRQFPEVDKPIISVTTSMEGASPQIIEGQITRPLEETLGGIEGLDYMTSRSETENSLIKLNFKVDRDIDLAAADVRDRLQKVRNKLPDEADDPLIKKADADAVPIIYLSLFSDRKSVNDLADYAHRFLESELQTIKGVASVEIFGGGNLEMHLILDPIRLNAYKVTATDVAAALKRQNIKKPAGRLTGEEREFTVTTSTSLTTPNQFNNMVIAEKEGRIIRLKDVGFAELNSEDKRFSSRFNGKNAVSIGIVKKSVANPLEVKKGVIEKVNQIREHLPLGTEVEISSDKTVFIQKSIEHVYRTIWEATFLVVVVVFMFLRSIRASIIPLVTIPVSLVGAFILMFLFGFTINILTLLALVLAIGLVVDDAIVVLENIYRYIEEGEEPFDAAIKGAKEISFAVIAMTLTLAAVYAPIALSSGITGRLFTEFALTLAGAVIISGFVALTLTPTMCAHLLTHHDHQALEGHRFAEVYQTFYEKTGLWLDKLDQAYAALLTLVLQKRLWVVLGGLFIALIGLYLAVFQLKRELTPAEDQGVLRTTADPPYGATLKYIEKYAHQMDKILSSVPELVKRMTVVQVGDYTYSNNTMLPWEERKRSCSEVEKAITPELKKIIGLDVRPRCESRSVIGGGSGFDLSFVIQTTRSYEDLADQMQKVWAAMLQHPGIGNIRPDMGEAGEDFKVQVDVEKAATLGIEPDVVAQTLDTLIGGRRSTTFERESKQYPVRVWVGEQFRRSPENVLEMTVKGQRNNKETLVPLKDIIKVMSTVTTPEIRHFEGLRSVTLDANLKDGYGLGQVLEDIKKVAEKILPDGYQTTVSGETRDYLKETYTIYLIFGLALAFIFLVMAAQFESFIDPFIIILSVPLSLAGALFTLWIFPSGTLNIYSQIGLVTLIGLITKHGILIVDFANKLQIQGKTTLEAVIEASRLRLRPILMTTFAMVFGAVPLAYSSGAGAETREQIGLVIVGGMSFGTFFTLFVIPVVYTYLSRKTLQPSSRKNKKMLKKQ